MAGDLPQGLLDTFRLTGGTSLTCAKLMTVGSRSRNPVSVPWHGISETLCFRCHKKFTGC
jgi:hypothetical protein